MSQRRCPTCGAVYSGEAKFCPKDGTQLVEILQSAAVKGGSTTQIRMAVKPPPSSADPAKTLRNQVLDSRYQIVKKLGEGGMSFVYEARDISTNESVAVKIMTPKLAQDKTAAERLRREAGLAMRLDHPHICRILRLGETADGLIMGLAHRDLAVYGVQFHPESIASQHGHAILKNFLDLTRRATGNAA